MSSSCLLSGAGCKHKSTNSGWLHTEVRFMSTNSGWLHTEVRFMSTNSAHKSGSCLLTVAGCKLEYKLQSLHGRKCNPAHLVSLSLTLHDLFNSWLRKCSEMCS